MRAVSQALLLVAGVTLGGCSCGAGTKPCHVDRDCIEGQVCLDAVCSAPRPDGGPSTGDDAGLDAGADAGAGADTDAGVDAGDDECTQATDTCDRDPRACEKTADGFACVCPSGFSGDGQGPNGCLLTDPSLTSLFSSTGTLTPAFVPGTTTYALSVPSTGSVTLTPSVQYPGHAAIKVDDVPVVSGTASSSLVIGTAPRVVSVNVTTESGQSRSYGVMIRRAPTHSPAYVKASTAAADANFGYAVSLSSSGSTLAVGGNSTANSGDVHVFTRANSQWSRQASLKASNAGAGDFFGGAVALSADGSTLAVAAAGESSSAKGVGGDQTDDSAPAAGAVYVFTRVGTQWSQQAYLKASNTEAGDLFGNALSLSANGSTLAVGAPSESSNAKGVGGDQADNSAPAAGAVYVFTRAGAQWSQPVYIKASDTEAGDCFGCSVALAADGATLAVGAPFESSSAASAGAVYVFTRAGTQWSEQADLKASNAREGIQFGYALTLSADGSTLAAGADSEDSNAKGVGGDQSDTSAPAAGAVYVFTRAGTDWSQQAYLKASNTEAQDLFGAFLSLSADGSTLAVGAEGESSSATGVDGNQNDNSAPGAGAVYVFARSGTQWSQQSYVKASNSEANDSFGCALSLSSDGSTVAVGALGEASSAQDVDGSQSDNSAPGAGAVYVY